MPKNFIYLCFTFACALRIIGYPFIKVLATLNEFIGKRLAFEELNQHIAGARSFNKDNEIARMAFEVSSEGELEQIKPIIQELLKNKDKVELIYASPSVEDKIKELYTKNPDLIRILRLPLVSFFFSWFAGPQVLSWVTAPVLVFCRYDFFPELFLLKKFKKTKLVLISGTLKNRQNILRRPGSFLYEYWSQVYQQFDYIVTATAQDKERFKLLGVNQTRCDSFDFRFIQILERLKMREEKLLKLGPFKEFLDSYSEKTKLLLAQCWPHEMSLFDNKEFQNKIRLGHKIVVLAPHQLNKGSLNNLISAFHQVWPEGRMYIFSRELSLDQIEKLISDYKRNPGPILMAIPGILCEVYSLFAHAYIGGGFGRSIHSVLEPFLAGPTVYCGPRTHRSTEYDLVKELSPDKIHVAHALDEIPSLFAKHSKYGAIDATHLLLDKTHKEFETITTRMFNVR